jgi:hypothetical protein
MKPSVSGLKKHSEIVEDILVSFEDSCHQIDQFDKKDDQYFMLKSSFKGVLERAIRRIKEAETE